MKFLTVASYVFSEGEGVESSVMGMVYKFIRSHMLCRSWSSLCVSLERSH